MKSGDLLFYSGTDIVESMIKIETGINYSSVGLIIELPNQWTHVKEQYILELCHNEGKSALLDPFRDEAISGLNLFDLEERIYNKNASAIWWAPITKPLEQEQIQILTRWILDMHDETFWQQSKTNRNSIWQNLKSNRNNIWKAIELTGEKLKVISEFRDKNKDFSFPYALYGPQLVALLFSQLALITQASIKSELSMSSVIDFGLHDLQKIKLVRVLKSLYPYYSSSDKSLDLKEALLFSPFVSFLGFSALTPSPKSFKNQSKQLGYLQDALQSKLSKEEKNLINLQSAELMKKKVPISE